MSRNIIRELLLFEFMIFPAPAKFGAGELKPAEAGLTGSRHDLLVKRRTRQLLKKVTEPAYLLFQYLLLISAYDTFFPLLGECMNLVPPR